MQKDEMRQAAEARLETLEMPLLRSDEHWPEPPYAQIFKCGVLPWRIKDGRLEYYLFKPKAKMPEKGEPGYQIGKGTREIYNPETKEWEDYSSPNQLEAYGEAQLEPMEVTALREGIEELGLRPKEIESAGNWGQAAFSSATTGELRTMWLYPLKMCEGCEFDEPHEEHAATVDRQWLDIQNPREAAKIRSDHLQIIRQIDKVLAEQSNNKVQRA